MADHKEPKEWTIPSRSYGITASNAADVLIESLEIKDNKPLYKAALVVLNKKKEALNKLV